MATGFEVVAFGARTPVGLTAATTAAAVRGRISGFREYAWVDPKGEPKIAAADHVLATRLEGRERLAPLGSSALAEACEALGAQQQVRLQLLLSLPEARPGFRDEDTDWVAEQLAAFLGESELQATVDTIERGHAGAMRLVERVALEPARYEDDLIVLLGVDSYHHPDTFCWLENHRLFAAADIRNGFVPGEGAGCLVLASPRTRARLGLRALANVRGVGTAVEQHLRDSPTGSFGVGMATAVEAAAAGISLPSEAVDTVYSDINGERHRSEEWGFVAMRASSVFKSLGYEAPADCWGDVGAASGVLAGVLAIEAFERGYAPGPRTLLMAGSDAGLRGALLLEDPRASNA